jgi:dextranase
MTGELFTSLPSLVLQGESLIVEGLPTGTAEVLVRTAFDTTYAASIEGDQARVDGLPVGTHAVEARSNDHHLLDEDFVSVRLDAGDDPIMGFVTTFSEERAPSVVSWLRQLRCTVVQMYDWMESYSKPLADSQSYVDPLGRPIELDALRFLIAAIRDSGAVAQAYAPVCAADEEFAKSHAAWLLLRNDGAPESLGTLLQIMDPANHEWQEHWIHAYGQALDALGFNGLHLDTYGYPRCATDSHASPVSVDEGYDDFVRAVRAARTTDIISFNQVNGVPRGFTSPARPGFRYAEVWPPNDRWRHLEGLLARSAGPQDFQGDTLAIYPPVWEGDRGEALRTVVLSEAIVTCLGANTLLWGDEYGVLCHPYYVEHETLLDDEIDVSLAWHRFGLRCRDLFKRGVDTSWYELADENASVTVSWEGVTSPEPVGGGLFVRVRRSKDVVVVSLLDLTGSRDGSWRSGTAHGAVHEVVVSVLVDVPERWRVQAAVLGQEDGRFAPFESTHVEHREGRALSCTVPIHDGWSVVRFEAKGVE